MWHHSCIYINVRTHTRIPSCAELQLLYRWLMLQWVLSGLSSHGLGETNSGQGALAEYSPVPIFATMLQTVHIPCVWMMLLWQLKAMQQSSSPHRARTQVELNNKNVWHHGKPVLPSEFRGTSHRKRNTKEQERTPRKASSSPSSTPFLGVNLRTNSSFAIKLGKQMTLSTSLRSSLSCNRNQGTLPILLGSSPGLFWIRRFLVEKTQSTWLHQQRPGRILLDTESRLERSANSSGESKILTFFSALNWKSYGAGSKQDQFRTNRTLDYLSYSGTAKYIYYPKSKDCVAGLTPWVGQDRAWRRQCQLTPISLPGRFYGKRSSGGPQSMDLQKLDATEHAHVKLYYTYFFPPSILNLSLNCFSEKNVGLLFAYT